MYLIESLLSAAMPRLTPARRSLAAHRAAEAVGATPTYADLAASIQSVVASHRALATLRDEWKAQRSSAAMHGRQAVEVDNQLDRAVSALHSVLDQYSRSLVDTVALDSARSLLEWCFPRGASAITNLPYVDQHAEVNILVEKLRAPESVQIVENLGLELAVSTVESLNARYGVLVTRSRDVTPERLQEADLASREAAAAFAAAVVGAFPTNVPEHVAARTELLSPFFDQKAEYARLRRRRTNEEDVFDVSGPDTAQSENGEDGTEEAEDESAIEDMA